MNGKRDMETIGRVCRYVHVYGGLCQVLLSDYVLDGLIIEWKEGHVRSRQRV